MSQLPAKSYVHLWEWHHASLTALAANPEDAFYCVFYDGEECVAIIPLTRKTITAAGMSLRALALPSHDHMPHTDLLVRPDLLPGLSLAFLERELATHVSAFDVLAFEAVLADSAAAMLVNADRPRLCFSEREGYSDALPAGLYESLLENLSKNFRGNLRKARNKLSKEGTRVRVVSAITPGELKDAFESFLAVEASGWKGRRGTAIGLDPALRDFYGQLVARLGPSGACAINVMLLDDRPIAAQFSILAGQRCYLLKIGYDESYAHLAPGNLLLEHLLKSYESHPAVRYVDLVSDAEWHASWKPERREVFRHLVFRPTPRGLLAWAALQGKPPVQRLRHKLKSGWDGALAAIRSFPWGGGF